MSDGTQQLQVSITLVFVLKVRANELKEAIRNDSCELNRVNFEMGQVESAGAHSTLTGCARGYVTRGRGKTPVILQHHHRHRRYHHHHRCRDVVRGTARSPRPNKRDKRDRWYRPRHHDTNILWPQQQKHQPPPSLPPSPSLSLSVLHLSIRNKYTTTTRKVARSYVVVFGGRERRIGEAYTRVQRGLWRCR